MDIRIIPKPKDSNIYRFMYNCEHSTPSWSHLSYVVDDSINMLSLRDKNRNLRNLKDSNIYRFMYNCEHSTPSWSHNYSFSFFINILSLRDKSKNDNGINFATACGKITLRTYFIDFQQKKEMQTQLF